MFFSLYLFFASTVDALPSITCDPSNADYDADLWMASFMEIVRYFKRFFTLSVPGAQKMTIPEQVNNVAWINKLSLFSIYRCYLGTLLAGFIYNHVSLLRVSISSIWPHSFFWAIPDFFYDSLLRHMTPYSILRYSLYIPYWILCIYFLQW